MNYNLFDTHTFIWYLEDNSKLSFNAKKRIESIESVNYVSIVSFWEIGIKISLKKLILIASIPELYQSVKDNGFSILPLKFEDTLLVSKLPFHHKDPFDRILVAQAINNNLEIITKDRNISKYEVEVFW